VASSDDLVRFRAGDPDAVRTVYREFGPLVYAIARRTLGSVELAEEATQQTFVKAWRAAASYDATRDLGPWLATIARRTAVDLHRRESRRVAGSLADVPDDHPAVVELPPGIDRAFEVWAVRRAVDELPPDEREVVRLQHLEQLTQVEVAARLGLALGTVKSRSYRAHRRLAARLGHLRDDERPTDGQTVGRDRGGAGAETGAETGEAATGADPEAQAGEPPARDRRTAGRGDR
jgi:RNA polymerase sigma-70 factor (ECF subfamily)